MFMKIAVCDDCLEDVLYLKSLLTGHNVMTYSDAGSLLTDLEDRNRQFDLYLIDIYIDDSMNGIDLAKRIRAGDAEAAICFVSTSDAFYREAYDLYAIQYLIKPVKEGALRQLLEKVSQQALRKQEYKLCFKWRGQTGIIPYANILFISSREHTISIYCKNGEVQEGRGKLNEFALQVCGDMLLRCHQSFIVNMYEVDNMSGSELNVSGHRIPVSRRYYAEVKKRYHEILFEEVE